MQLYADLEDLHRLLPVEIVVADEGGEAALEILQPIQVMSTVATSLLVKIPILRQFPDIIVIGSILRSYRGT
jgi:hypothetical protein